MISSSAERLRRLARSRLRPDVKRQQEVYPPAGCRMTSDRPDAANEHTDIRPLRLVEDFPRFVRCLVMQHGLTDVCRFISVNKPSCALHGSFLPNEHQIIPEPASGTLTRLGDVLGQLSLSMMGGKIGHQRAAAAVRDDVIQRHG